MSNQCCIIGTINNTASGGAITGDINQILEIPIGAWDMDITPSVSVAHGLTITNIRSAQVLIFNDGDTLSRDLTTAVGPIAGSWSIDTVNFILSRTGGGFFDSIDFNDPVKNRGFILVGVV